jgi:hypothetical protein
MICHRCKADRVLKEFREKKGRNGKTYQVKICIYCERIQKKKAEQIRYANLNDQQIDHRNKLARNNRQKESYKEWHRSWQRNKEKLDVLFKLKRRVSSLLRNSLNKKGESFVKVFGYTPDELRSHLESKFEPWMNWENWGVYNPDIWDDNDSKTWTWNIDHIIPIHQFTYTSYQDEEFIRCWGLENLRPLSSKENILKRDLII